MRTYDPQLRIYGLLTTARTSFGCATLSGKNHLKPNLRTFNHAKPKY